MVLAMLTMKKRVAWVAISMHACDPVAIVVALRLATIRGRRRSSAVNRPRSIYQYSNMALRLSRQTPIFGIVFFVSVRISL